MISIQNVTVEKDGCEILSSVSVDLTGKRIGIIGANGSGKSTFAKLLNGLVKPSSGNILFKGSSNETQSPELNVGFVFQNPDNQIVFPIVDEDLAFGLKKSKLSNNAKEQKIRSHLERFGLVHLLKRRTHELSGGEKQLIALIGVLVMEPEVIVFDEPTTLLDLRNRTLFLSHLSKLEQNIIVVSHDLELMKTMDQLIWLDGGRVYGSGDPSEIIGAYRNASELDDADE